MKIPTELKESRALFLRTYQRVEPSANTGIVNFLGRVLSESEKKTVENNLLRWFVTAAISWNAIENVWAAKFQYSLSFVQSSSS
jgi:hypothetical protein